MQAVAVQSGIKFENRTQEQNGIVFYKKPSNARCNIATDSLRWSLASLM